VLFFFIFFGLWGLKLLQLQNLGCDFLVFFFLGAKISTSWKLGGENCYYKLCDKVAYNEICKAIDSECSHVVFNIIDLLRFLFYVNQFGNYLLQPDKPVLKLEFVLELVFLIWF